MNKSTLKAYRKRLEAKRDELYNAYRDKLSRSEDSGNDGALDPADEADANYNKEYWLYLSNKDRRLLRMIDEALQKMDKEEFGECQNCGKQIQSKRLEAVPWARLCIECQELHDREKHK